MDGQFPFHVFPSAGEPIYRQLMDQVKFRVASGRMKPGDFLPSVREVAQELAVNPMTVSKAYSLLEREGVVTHDRGQAMRIAASAVRGNLRERREDLKASLKDVVVKAHHVGLDSGEVLKLLQPLLAELDRNLAGGAK